MIRRAAAVVLALALNPAFVLAQDTVFTVNASSADIYKGPSNVTPVVGHASSGAVLTVSRNLGSWVKVSWPDAPDGVGYVYIANGTLGSAVAATPAASVPHGSAATSSTTTASAASTTPLMRTSVGEPIVPSTQGSTLVTPESHIFGVGGLIGSTSTFGATARAWHNDRLGIQLGLTRDSMTSDVAAGRVTSMQFEPGVLFALFDSVTDYVWLRPYVGSVVSFNHQTLSGTTPLTLETSENGVGYRVFGGSELTFASMPRFGLSADVGYRKVPSSFPGFEPSPLFVSIAGHWYVK